VQRHTAGLRRCYSSSVRCVMLSQMAMASATFKARWELLPQGFLFGSTCPTHSLPMGTSAPMPAVRSGPPRCTPALRSCSSASPPLPPPLQTVCQTNVRGSSSRLLLGCSKYRGRNFSSCCGLRLVLFWEALPSHQSQLGLEECFIS